MSAEGKVWILLASLVTIDTRATGFLDAYFYMVPPKGTISICDSQDNDTVVFTLISQASVVEFTTEIPRDIEGYVQLSNPVNACKHVEPPPGLKGKGHVPFDLELVNEEGRNRTRRWILLASKSDCLYITKIQSAEAAGYGAIIIFNVGSNDTEVIGLSDEEAGRPIDILIPSFFIGAYDGFQLKNIVTSNTSDRYFVKIHTNPPVYRDVILYLLWTTLGVFIFILGLCVAKPIYECSLQPWVERHRRDRRKILLTRAVSSLAIVEWKDDLIDKFETCVICMEEYGEAELLRILPCNHGFHPPCIDFWLLKVRRVCPICKKKVSYSCWEDLSDSDISDGNYFTDADFAYEPFSINGGRRETRFRNWRRQFVDLEENGVETVSTPDLSSSSIDSIGTSSIQFDTEVEHPLPSTSYMSTTVSVHDYEEGQRSDPSSESASTSTWRPQSTEHMANNSS